ncbi:hypothetical protein [Pseudonocardia abyssalis]|jgi:hypothetical protein|uniref:Uncharacterized protein n=1 Tax=Pseudonocardia abyssalis TaxID=2792008 RepID=A0ABS6ULM3_9PSEU|nr:hypothetical protein [Pseudonocardia abyssalis]MBW0116495.1 hypothetical protein [Pseudonocardia abyssalis]MBW0132821.1 hypothetical protein [Pseudonocardia abyssalis]
MGGHRGTEYRLIMLVICGVCALGPLSAAFPIVEHYANIGLGLLLAIGGLAWVFRAVRREVRIRARLRALDGRDPARQNQTAVAAVHPANGGRW